MEWGMSEKLGRVRYKSSEQEVFLGHSMTQSTNMCDDTAKLIDQEVRKLIEDGEAVGQGHPRPPITTSGRPSPRRCSNTRR